jgi:hypothetical protein
MSARTDQRRRAIRRARLRDRHEVDRVQPGDRIPIGEWTAARLCAMQLIRQALGWPTAARLELAEHLIEQGQRERDLVLIGIGQGVRAWVRDAADQREPSAPRYMS